MQQNKLERFFTTMTTTLITEDLESTIQRILSILNSKQISKHLEKGNIQNISIKQEEKFLYTENEDEPKQRYVGTTIKIFLNDNFQNQIHVFVPNEINPIFLNARKLVILNYDSERGLHLYPNKLGEFAYSDNSFFKESSSIDWKDFKRKLYKQFETYWDSDFEGIEYVGQKLRQSKKLM